MTFEKWVKSYIGKRIDFDGCYGVQCVDLVDHYIYNVIGLKIGYYGNAKTWWENRNTNWLKTNFTAVTPKYTNGELKAGDIGIRTLGTYGHIFVIAGVNKNGTFDYYDQNATGHGDAMTLRTKPYNKKYITGVLRPKKTVNLPKEQKTTMYGNAKMNRGVNTYADSDLSFKVGSVSKNERVIYLGTGEGNPMICYKTSAGYKVGFVTKGVVVRD